MQELPVGRDDGFGDGSRGLGSQPVRFPGIQMLGRVEKRREEYAVFRAVDDGAGYRRHDPVQNHSGLSEPIREAATHIVDVLREEGSDCVQPQQVLFVVFQCPERHRLVHALNPDMEAGIARERHSIRAIVRQVRSMTDHEVEQVVVRLIVRGQRGSVDGFEPLQELQVFFQRALFGCSRHIRQAVVVVGHPSTARKQWVPLQAATPFVREQLLQFGRRLLPDRHSRATEYQNGTKHAHDQRISIQHVNLRGRQPSRLS